MGNKIKTVGLLGVVVFLFVTTIYVSQLLKQESESTPTTIKKTKASSITYKRTVDIAVASPTPTLTPTPLLNSTPSLSGTPFPAIQSTTITITPSQAPLDISPTPTTTLLAANDLTTTPTPTEIILAKATSTPAQTLSETMAATITKTQNLPEVGWIKPSHILFLFAFSLIFFSLIY